MQVRYWTLMQWKMIFVALTDNLRSPAPVMPVCGTTGAPSGFTRTTNRYIRAQNDRGSFSAGISLLRCAELCALDVRCRSFDAGRYVEPRARGSDAVSGSLSGSAIGMCLWQPVCCTRAVANGQPGSELCLQFQLVHLGSGVVVVAGAECLTFH